MDAFSEDIAATLAEAAGAWPGIRLPAEVFGAFVMARVPPTGALSLGEAIGRLHTADLYLVCACLQGDEAALRAFDSQFLRPLEPVVRRVMPNAPDDALQAVRERLLVGKSPTDAPKLTEYAGRGALGAWLRVAALRVALNLRRKKLDEPTEDPRLTRMVDAGRDPEFDYIQARFRADFTAAFALAATDLTKRQRSLLGFPYVDKLTLEQVANVYRVSRATAARWLADARAALLAGTRNRIAERLAISDSQIDSMMNLLGSRIDVSVSALLRSRSRSLSLGG